MKKQPLESFNWEVYAQTVLASIDQLRKDVDHIRSQIEGLQESCTKIGILTESLNNVKEELKKVSKELDEVQDEFKTCQLKSVEKGGLNNIEIALLKSELHHEVDEKNKQAANKNKVASKKNANRGIIISAILTLIGGIIILLLDFLINKK